MRLASEPAYDWNRVRYCSFTVVSVRQELIAEASFPALRALRRLGIAIAAIMAMIATTIISSINVKPWLRFMGVETSKNLSPVTTVPAGFLAGGRSLGTGRGKRSARGAAYLKMALTRGGIAS